MKDKLYVAYKSSYFDRKHMVVIITDPLGSSVNMFEEE